MGVSGAGRKECAASLEIISYRTVAAALARPLQLMKRFKSHRPLQFPSFQELPGLRGSPVDAMLCTSRRGGLGWAGLGWAGSAALPIARASIRLNSMGGGGVT